MPFEGRNVFTMVLNDAELMESFPENKVEASKPNKTNKFMTHPIFDFEGNLYGFLQVSAKTTKTNKDKGFSNSDKMFLQLFCLFFQIKAQTLISNGLRKQVEKKVNDTINVSAQISSQRTLTDLTMACEEYLASFLGFKGCGLLFKDTKTSMLFSVSPDWNEKEQQLLKAIKAKKEKRIPLTDKERIDYLGLQLKENSRYSYLNS